MELEVMMESFKALVVDKNDSEFRAQITKICRDKLPEGDVFIKVDYSSVNFKDGLAANPNGNVVKKYPMIPGIDLAGTILNSKDTRFKEGDDVIVTSYDLGIAHYGGYSEYASVPGDWVVPLPKGLTKKEAMAIGTAGFTAALSIFALENAGVSPNNGSVLVTGASGGVGSMAVSMLSKLNYHVVASSGNMNKHEWLYKLGAKEVIGREDLLPEKVKSLDSQKWAGAIDPVGGKTLAYILSTMKYGGSVAVSGLTGGTNLQTTVFPFILRGVNLLGIDSVYCPMSKRLEVWETIANDLKPEFLLKLMTQDITLDELPEALNHILNNQISGRLVVNI
jgi:acrylyl-CoA reductase (NADPH)